MSVARGSCFFGPIAGLMVEINMGSSDVTRRHWPQKPTLLKTYKGRESALFSHPSGEDQGGASRKSSQLRICEFRCEDVLACRLEDFPAVAQQKTTSETGVDLFNMEVVMTPEFWLALNLNNTCEHRLSTSKTTALFASASSAPW